MPSLPQRVVQRPIFWVLVTCTLLALPIGRSVYRGLRALPTLPVLAHCPDFRLTDETGAEFSRSKLAGKVVVADFIFTRCAGACPLMSARLEKIQKRTRQLGRAFHMISISADPERDSPEDLTAYAHRYHANPRGWSFLTGDRPVIEALARALLIGLGKEVGEGGMVEIVHGEKLILIDQKGAIRGYFDATDQEIDDLVAAVALLVNSPQ
jgi:protein SCO1/2